jgi:hypothetical protein
MDKIKMTNAAQAAWEDYLRNYENLRDEDDTEQDYREWLDSLNGEIRVGSITWDASYVLENLDPIAFRCGFSDYTDSQDLHEISIDGKLYFSDKSEEDLLEEFQSDECYCCDDCGGYCLPDELTANDPEDGFSEQFCPDCVAAWEAEQ